MRTAYIDETETEKYFIVCALTVESETELEESFKSFKKKTKNLMSKSGRKQKGSVFEEFKSREIDDAYPSLKRAMLNHIDLLDCRISYSFQKKTQPNIKFEEKRELYYNDKMS